nr:hypothetical protein [Tanacetum cinerariifolium]
VDGGAKSSGNGGSQIPKSNIVATHVFSPTSSSPASVNGETSSAGNAPAKPSYATAAGKPSGTKVNFRTLYTPRGNGIDVVIPVESIRTVSERFSNTAYGYFLGKKVAYPVVVNYVRNTWGKYGLPDVNLLKEDFGTVHVWVKLHSVPITTFSEDGLSAIATKLGTPLTLDSYTTDTCIQSWGRSSYARAMIELRAYTELKDNIVAAMPKIVGEGHYTCNIRVEYEWKPPRCACCKIFGHVLEECPKNMGVGVTKNVKKTSQTPKGIPVGQKMVFKPKKFINLSLKSLLPTMEGTRRQVWNLRMRLVSQTLLMRLIRLIMMWNWVPTGDLHDWIENLIIDGKSILVDNDVKPLRKADEDSEDEVALVDNDMAKFLAKNDGYGTQSLLEQWKDSHEHDDYEYNPYDDDLYEDVIKIHIAGSVWSKEYIDHGFTKSVKEHDRCYVVLEELRSMIVGGALIHMNREGSKHESRRIHPTLGNFGGNYASNQSSFNNGRVKE